MNEKKISGIRKSIEKKKNILNNLYKTKSKTHGLYKFMVNNFLSDAEKITADKLEKLNKSVFLEDQKKLSSLILDIAQIFSPNFINRKLIEMVLINKQSLKQMGFIDLYKKSLECKLKNDDIQLLFRLIPDLLKIDTNANFFTFEDFLIIYGGYLI